MARNKKPTNTGTDIVISPPESFEQYLTLGKTQIDKEEAYRIFFLYARQRKFMDSLGTHTETRIAQCAINFMVILHGACQKHGRSTKDFKGFEQAVAFIRSCTAFQEIVVWLHQDTKRRLHIEESGSERSFKLLYQFSPYSDLVNLTSFALFEQEVFDYKTWFFFAEYALKNMKKGSLATLFKTKKGLATNRWNKRRFFFTFLLSMHYRTDIRTFTLEEIYGMVKQIQTDYGVWLRRFKGNLKSLKDDSLANMLMQHSGMKVILSNLQMPEYQTVHFIASEVKIRPKDEASFKDLDYNVRSAVVYVSSYQYNIFSPIKWGDPEAEMKNCLEVLNRKLGEWPHRRLAEVFSKKPWLLGWLDKNNLMRLRVASVGPYEGNNAIISSKAGEETLSAVDELLDKTLSLKDVIRNLWQLRTWDHIDLREMLPTDGMTATSYDDWSLEYLNKVVEELLYAAFNSGPVYHLGQAIIDLDHDWSARFPKESLPLAKWLAISVIFGDRLPKYVFGYLREEMWYQYVADEQAKAWLAKLINASTAYNLRERLPGKFEGNIQEVVDRISGFTVA